MSLPIPASGVNATPPPPAAASAAAAPNAANPMVAAAVQQSNPSEVSSMTKIGSMADLKKKSPKVYNLMMQGIAQNVIKDMQWHANHLKELMRGTTT